MPTEYPAGSATLVLVVLLALCGIFIWVMHTGFEADRAACIARGGRIETAAVHHRRGAAWVCVDKDDRLIRY